MTAEVAVMNRQAIALAADSAVTVTTSRGSRKAWPSVTKIFAMPEPHSVALMIYGSTGFHRAPWETIIKQFAGTLPAEPLRQLSDYRTSFLRYLRRRKVFHPEAEQALYVYTKLVLEYLDLRDDIDAEIEDRLEASASGQLSPAEQRQVIDSVIRGWQDALNSRPRLKRLPKNFNSRFSSTYGRELRDAKQGVFQQLPLTAAQSRRLSTIGRLMFEREWPIDFFSGIVVAGYGGDDLFPKVHPLFLEGFLLNYLVMVDGNPAIIDRENTAAVRAFAQGDDVYAFMEGVLPAYRKTIEHVLHQRMVDLPQELIDELKISEAEKKRIKKELFDFTHEVYDRTIEELRDYRRERFVDPVLSVVAALPMEDLAVMAETLVSLASFRQKVSMSVETVGGPVDVAMISKGDGFVWIKRKNYFSLEQNPRVLARHFR